MIKLDVTYIRYSDTKQDDGYSIEYQTTEVKQYAERNGFSIDKFYIDKAHTATKVAGREEFFRLANAVKEGKIRTIIVYKLSRLFRNALESAKYRALFRKHGVKLISVTEIVDEDTSSGRFQTNIMSSVDQYQSETISDHVKSSMREMARQGYYTGGVVTYGYTLQEELNGKKKRKKFIPEPTEAAVIVRIFDMYLDGMPLSAIAETLNNEGVPTRRKKLWDTVPISRIIKNDMYIGVYRFKTSGYDDIVVEDCIPPIVDKMKWILANEKKKEGLIPLAPRPRKNQQLYCLTGKIICDKCGEHFTGFSHKTPLANEIKLYSYYLCKNRKRFNRCEAKMIRKEMIEDAVMRAIKSLILNDEKIREIAEMVYEICQQSPSDLTDKIKAASKEKRQLETRIENLLDALADGQSDATMRRVMKMEGEVKTLEKKIYVLTERKKDEITVEKIIGYMNNLFDKLSSNNEDEIKSVFDTFVQEVVVSDKDVFIKLNAFAAAPFENVPVKQLERYVSRDDFF